MAPCSRQQPAQNEESVVSQQQVRFDDLPALQALVTEEFTDWSPSIEVPQSLIGEFADLTGDHQWIHLDQERCQRESPYGTTIAHGLLVLSLIPKLQSRLPFEVTGYKIMVNYGSDRLRFTGAVPSGSRIHARSRLKEVRAAGDGTVINLENHVHVVGDERPALIYELLVRFA